MRAAHHSRTSIARRLDELSATAWGGALDAADGRADHREPRLHGLRLPRRSHQPRGTPGPRHPVGVAGRKRSARPADRQKPEGEPARRDRPLRRLPLPARPRQEPLRPHQRECDRLPLPRHPHRRHPPKPCSVNGRKLETYIENLWRTQMAEEAFLIRRTLGTPGGPGELREAERELATFAADTTARSLLGEGYHDASRFEPRPSSRPPRVAAATSARPVPRDRLLWGATARGPQADP